MNNDLDKAIDTAIEKMADNVRAQQDQGKCLHFSQAALNLAQTKATLNSITKGSLEPKK